jgi:hypothetical protein
LRCKLEAKMRVETLVPGFVARRVPERPEWVAENQRDPRTAARVYGTFALAFSTLFCALWAIGSFNPATLLFVPLVVANAYSWTWLIWRLHVPPEGPVSRRRALTAGFAIGTCSWLTVGFLISGALTGFSLLTGTDFATMEPLGAVLALGVLITVAGFVLTLGVPTVASVGLALWTLDYEERSGREQRKSNYDFD